MLGGDQLSTDDCVIGDRRVRIATHYVQSRIDRGEERNEVLVDQHSSFEGVVSSRGGEAIKVT